MIDLGEDLLETVINILKKHVPDREVWVFGSRTGSKAKKFSDLDLAIIGEKSLNREILINLEEAFEESDLPIKVDVVDWASVSKEFQEIIKEKHEVILKPSL